MIWHIVRLDFTGIDEADRQDVEDRLAALTSIDEVAWLRLARDVEEPAVTGLITAFDTVEDLAAYRVHPDHIPVVERIRELGLATARLDLATDDQPLELP